jgi:Tol biopolymer transport system component
MHSVKNLAQNMGTMLALLLLVMGLSALMRSPLSPTQPHARQPQTLPGAQLLYLQENNENTALMALPAQDMAALTASQPGALATTSPNGLSNLHGLWPAPQGGWLASEINGESGGYTQLLQTSSGKSQQPGTDLGLGNNFLAWSPAGEAILRVERATDYAVFRVDPVTGAATPLPLPNFVYNLAFSPDGQRILYSITAGLGYGSQTFIANSDGSNPQLILDEPKHIIAFARWSPTGEHIAYLRWADTAIPFTVGELWLADGNGGSPVLLAAADAGHGYEPAWSPDGAYIAFVGRENGQDAWADQVPDLLTSNIYLANAADRSVLNLTQFSGARTENPSWSPDGSLLAFSTTQPAPSGQDLDGSLDIWLVEIASKQIQPVTQGANARYPAWVAGTSGE